MPKRKSTDIIKMNVRMREVLRQRLEREAKRNATSLNSEIVRRLEQSLAVEDRISDLVGGEKNLQLFKVLGPAIAAIEAKTGAKWEDDVETWARVSKSFAAILQGFRFFDDAEPSSLSHPDALAALAAGNPALSTIAGAAEAGRVVKRVVQGDQDEGPPTE
jgi:Arc-like DNA binding domain